MGEEAPSIPQTGLSTQGAPPQPVCSVPAPMPAQPVLLFPWVWGCAWEDATSPPKHGMAEAL